VGYTIWVTTPELEFDAVRYPRVAQIASCGRALFNRGTVIGVSHQGAGLAARLAAHTAESGRAAGYRYQIGTVNVLNMPSLRYIFRFGKTLIGMSTGGTGLNYVSCYFLGRTELIAKGDDCLATNVELAALILQRERIVAMREAAGIERFVYGDAVECEDK
jgi:hypothetical protein